MNEPLPIAIITSRSFRGESDHNNVTKPNQLIEFLGNLESRFCNQSNDFKNLKQKLRVHSTHKTATAISDYFNSKTANIVKFIDYNRLIKENIFEWIKYKYGSRGGTVQIASKCVNKKISAVFLLLDPDNFKSYSPENMALIRICIRKKIPLLTSIRAADEWFEEEFESVYKSYIEDNKNKEKERDSHAYRRRRKEDSANAPEGFPSIAGIRSSVKTQTIALISHDEMKMEMIRFVENFPDVLSSFYRILATGTTGWLIKTLFADEQLRSKFLRQAKEELGNDRYKEFVDTSKKIQNELWLNGFPKPCPSLVKKIYPLYSGPEGGDILIANEVVERKCDYIIFTQDPMRAHPHSADINLLQRTCQITEHNAVCISDKDSAEIWAKAKQKTWRLYE